jgi:hypothetical protein
MIPYRVLLSFLVLTAVCFAAGGFYNESSHKSRVIGYFITTPTAVRATDGFRDGELNNSDMPAVTQYEIPIRKNTDLVELMRAGKFILAYTNGHRHDSYCSGLYVLERKNLRVVWRTTREDHEPPIRIYLPTTNRVYLLDCGGNLYALDLQTGRRIWQLKGYGGASVALSVSKGRIHFWANMGFGSCGRQVFCELDSRGKELRSRIYDPIYENSRKRGDTHNAKKLPDTEYESCGLDDGGLHFSAVDRSDESSYSSLTFSALKNKQILWQNTLMGATANMALEQRLAGRYIVAVARYIDGSSWDSKNAIYVLDKITGKLVMCFRDLSPNTQFDVHRENLFFTSQHSGRNILYTASLDGGRITWYLNDVCSFMIDGDRLFIGYTGGRIGIIELRADSLPDE